MLDRVDLDLHAGELVVVTGEDGCGTSTLLRALAGGKGVVANGAVALLSQPPGDDWSDVDVVHELLPSSGRNVLAALGGDGLDTARKMWTLSGGERQRVRLARMLAAAPAPTVLLLDEPLGYLDNAGVRAALDLLRARADAGTAVLAVVKSDGRALLVADRVLELADGTLATSG